MRLSRGCSFLSLPWFSLSAVFHDFFSHIRWKKEGRVQTSVSPSVPLPHLLHHIMENAHSLVEHVRVFHGTSREIFSAMGEDPIGEFKGLAVSRFQVFFQLLVLIPVDVSL